MDKKAIIIDPFNNYEIRSKYVKNCLEGLGYETIIVSSDFSHNKKTYVEKSNADDVVFIDTPAYFKNLSYKRIKSHRVFARRVYGYVANERPDLIYCILPPNSLAKYMAKYQRANGGCRVFFDVLDLWPESLPAPSGIKKALFAWKNLRNKNLKTARKVITECSLYKKYLPQNISSETIYLCKQRQVTDFHLEWDVINFVYVGSINNIIDIDGIVELLSRINKRRAVNLHIIGGGEATEKFLSSASSAELNVINHGTIYDEQIKTEIISTCHFGINMYKSGLCIGLTMKSLDYFSRGLPIVTNNIFDTAQIVEKYGCGYVLDGNSVSDVENAISNITYEKWSEMKDNVVNTYDNLFSTDTVVDKLTEVLGI